MAIVGGLDIHRKQLTFDYAQPDITWTLQLRAEIVDAKSVNLQLLAAINMNASETYRSPVPCNRRATAVGRM